MWPSPKIKSKENTKMIPDTEKQYQLWDFLYVLCRRFTRKYSQSTCFGQLFLSSKFYSYGKGWKHTHTQSHTYTHMCKHAHTHTEILLPHSIHTTSTYIPHSPSMTTPHMHSTLRITVLQIWRLFSKSRNYCNETSAASQRTLNLIPMLYQILSWALHT